MILPMCNPDPNESRHGAEGHWPRIGSTGPAGHAAPAPPLFHSAQCAAHRNGLSGCRSCADVCPHQALNFTASGPVIDESACQRCGACSAACPVAALERTWLPDEELFATIAAAVADGPAELVLTCNHDGSEAPEPLVGTVRLALPCIQVISDDMLVFAMAAGAQSVRISAEATCPHPPHTGPARAVAVAQAVLAARGWSRTALGMGEGVVITPISLAQQAVSSAGLELRGSRYLRREMMLDLIPEGPRATTTRGATSAVVPWREAVVDQNACTSCGACAYVCPTGALRLGDGGSSLYGSPASCIGCGLCELACPEDALTLTPVIPVDSESRLLARSVLAHCAECGGELLPEALVHQVEQRLDRTDGASRRALRVCERCKGTHLFALPARAADHSGPSTASVAVGVSPIGREVTDAARAIGNGGVSRRDFVQLAGLGVMATAGLSGCAAAAEATEADHRYGMVIDTKRCVGCEACVIACKAENKTPPGVNYMLLTNNTLGDRPDDKPLFTAKPCFHCEHPPCVDVCPVSATFKRKQDGIVVMDYDRCIGCRYCQTACPYGARFFDFGENYAAETADGPYNPASPEYNQFRPRSEDASPIGNVRKCSFCMHLQDEHGEYDKDAGRWPACAKTCTGHAIHFGDFNDPDSDISRLVRERQPIRLKDELGAEPNVMYLL